MQKFNTTELLKNKEFRAKLQEKLEATMTGTEAVDLIGNTYKVGDEVVYTSSYGRSKSLLIGIVVGIGKTGKKVQITNSLNIKGFAKGSHYLSTTGKMANNVVKIVREIK